MKKQIAYQPRCLAGGLGVTTRTEGGRETGREGERVKQASISWSVNSPDDVLEWFDVSTPINQPATDLDSQDRFHSQHDLNSTRNQRKTPDSLFVCIWNLPMMLQMGCFG